jgi:hypothetical protein
MLIDSKHPLLAALLNQKAGTRWVRYRRVELIGLAVLWYAVLLVGTLLRGIGGA